MTADPIAAPAASAPLAEFAAAFDDWLTAHDHDVRPLLDVGADFDQRVTAARALRRLLWEAEWGRYGWPDLVGGRGGTSLHRAVVNEQLFRRGWTGPTVFEHVEIIAPTLVAHATPELAADLLPSFLDGSRSWAQGFSEPEAGSDLASLRTRGVIDGTELVVTGTKIWTTWAKYAHWCLALVRTGTAEERHRGLTMVAIDLTSPGVQVSPIKQGNGIEELAEVAFDDVRVPLGNVVGEVGGGWRVAMYLLARERGTLAWLRHGLLRQRLAEAGAGAGPDVDRQLGALVLATSGVRASAATLLAREARGEELGPLAAYSKLLMTRTEQSLYDFLRDVDGTPVAHPGSDSAELLLQQDYHFSRIVTVYGGSQQMQLITVARQFLGLGNDG